MKRVGPSRAEPTSFSLIQQIGLSNMSIHFPKKPRKDASTKGMFTIDGSQVVIGTDLLRNTEILDAKERTKKRACFIECQTCGTCGNSRRGTSDPRRYDSNAGKVVNCIGCEPYRFHDCSNGFLRDSYGEAEPFTEDVQKLFDEGARPLIK
jgi:hypothetical protein